MDFGGFWEASWEGKSSQERTKSDPKTHRKNNEPPERESMIFHWFWKLWGREFERNFVYAPIHGNRPGEGREG